MIRIKKVLVPIDFSEVTGEVVRYGIEISRDRGSKLYFLHVVNQRTIDAMQEIALTGEKGSAEDAIERLMKERENELVTKVPQRFADGIETVFLIRRGKPAEEIIEAAREQEIDLIIMGSHGRSGVMTLLVGSVAQNVVNHAPCSVLVVRPLAHDFVE